MKIKANNIQEYIKNIPEDRKNIFDKLMKTVRKNIPKGFSEELSYGFPILDSSFFSLSERISL